MRPCMLRWADRRRASRGERQELGIGLACLYGLAVYLSRFSKK